MTGPPRPPANQTPAVELRILDPGGQHLTLTWQIRNGHGHLLASGQVAGAPNTAALAGWRYDAFTDAAKAAITALKDLEHAARPRVCDFCAAAPSAWRYPVQRQRPAAVLVGELLVVPAGQGAALWASFRARRSGPAVPLGGGHGPAGHSHREPGR